MQEAKKDEDVPQEEQVLRCWIEVRELANGSVRKLPLNAVTKIHLPRRKKDVRLPNEEILRLEDDGAALEARDLEDLKVQLRARYPDEAYERTLWYVRDREAEIRRKEALEKLREIFVPRVFLEALYVMLEEFERIGPDTGLPDAELEKLAARRGMELIDADRWKQRDTWCHFPPSWVRQVLEMFASGRISLLDPTPKARSRKKGASRGGGAGRSKRRPDGEPDA